MTVDNIDDDEKYETIWKLRRKWGIESWRLRRAVDTLGDAIIRDGNIRLIPKSVLPQLRAELNRRGWLNSTQQQQDAAKKPPKPPRKFQFTDVKGKHHRCDQIAELVYDHVHGDGERLQEELDGMHSLLREWEADYAAEKEYRLSLVTGMVADLCGILQAYLAIQDDKLKPLD